MGILWTLAVGAIVGWMAGQMMKGRGFGLIGNIVVGIVGAVLGDYLFDLAGISIGSGTVSSIVTALIGALVLLFLVGLVKRS